MKRVKRKKLVFILVVICIIIVYIAFNVICICSYSSRSETKKCDVGIVLGAATNNGVVSEVYKQRIHHAIELYHEGYIAKIIVTGGKAEKSRYSDAYIAKIYTKEQGIPQEDILLEECSTITQENLKNAKKIMEDNQYKTALIISDPLHMKRAMLLAKDINILAFSSPTRTSAYRSLKTKIPFVARETFFYIGYKWYRIFVNK